MIHIDAHSDTATDMMGERLAHGTPFRKSFSYLNSRVLNNNDF